MPLSALARRRRRHHCPLQLQVRQVPPRSVRDKTAMTRTRSRARARKQRRVPQQATVRSHAARLRYPQRDVYAAMRRARPSSASPCTVAAAALRGE